MIPDRVLASFLQRQHEEAMALAHSSDRLDLLPLGTDHGPPNRYVARYRCPTLIRSEEGTIVQAEEFTVGIWFSAHFLRDVDPLQIVSWLHPENCWHPNVRVPFICLGRIAPGTTLVDLLYQVFEIATYRNYAMHDGLNAEACQWARNHLDRFPLDTQPLKRRSLDLQCKPIPRGKEP